MRRLLNARDAFINQSRYCQELGSPFMARLCRLFADHLTEEDSVTNHLLNLPRPDNFWNIALPLRVAGALHAMVLNNHCQALAKVYPPHHDKVSDKELWQAIAHAMQAHEDFFLPFLDSAPQTNEVRRSAILLPGFLKIAGDTGLPFTLSELGASAGINLCWDAFGYRLGNTSWGDLNCGVIMAPEWQGNPPPDPLPISVKSRAGCDLNPINHRDPGARRKLLSYIWADQEDRFARTDRALDILAAKQYAVESANISNWLPERLALDTSGTVHVIYHTIAWNYQDDDAQELNTRRIEEAGKNARADAPLAWLRFEADGKDPGAAITLTLWPDGIEHSLGRADYHGRWIDWSG